MSDYVPGFTPPVRIMIRLSHRSQTGASASKAPAPQKHLAMSKISPTYRCQDHWWLDISIYRTDA